MNSFGDSVITIAIMIAFFSIMTIFFNYGRKIRLNNKKRKLIKKSLTMLELKELPLQKNKEIHWKILEGKAKKLPDSREKYMFLREIRDQIQFSKITKK